MIEITSLKNPIIKEIKSLYRKKDRWETRLFLMEGIKIIEEAISNDINLRYIILNNKLLSTENGQKFCKKNSSFRNLIKVPDNIFKEICDTDNPQGILAIGEFEINLLDSAKDINSYLIFLDGLQDPGNIGTIIRTCDAFSYHGIVLGENCADPYNPKVVRATMGSIFRVPIYYTTNNIDSLENLKNKNYKIYATSLMGSIPNYEIDYNGKYVIVIGNESRGVDEMIIRLADELIKIPMPGGSESLNAGVAASIIMYEAMKQRNTIHNCEGSKLGSNENTR